MPDNPIDQAKGKIVSQGKQKVRKGLETAETWANIGEDMIGSLHPLGVLNEKVRDGIQKAYAVVDTVTGIIHTVDNAIDKIEESTTKVNDTLQKERPSLEGGAPNTEPNPGSGEDGPGPETIPETELDGENPTGPTFQTVPPIPLEKIDIGPTKIQKDKLLQIYTIHEIDTFLLQSMIGESGVSSLYEHDLLILSKRANVPFEDLMGSQILVRIQLPNGEYRPLHGIVANMTAEEKSRLKYFAYQIKIVPKLWFCQLNSTSQIFLDRTIPEIVDEVLQEQGFIKDLDYEWRLTRPINEYRTTEYKVQYSETYFNFLSRLLEEEGIYYFFEHLDAPKPGHKVIFVDSLDQVPICPTLPYVKAGIQKGNPNISHSNDGTVHLFRVEQTTGVKSYKHRDWNWSIPNRFWGEFDINPETYTPWVSSTPWRQRDIYSYPGDFVIHQNGPKSQEWAQYYAHRRAEEAITMYSTKAEGTGSCTGMQAGYKVVIRSSDPGQPEKGNPVIYNHPYFITATQEEATVGAAYYVDQYVEGLKEAEYEVRFQAYPASLPYRPPRISPVPRIYGYQTAIVVPETGRDDDPNREIFTDEYGRIKVKFHWDLREPENNRSSCWLRVATLLSGINYGTLFLPRVGMEVVVGFLEGNPDYPLVTGAVYNENHKPPYELPLHKTRSTTKTHSTLDGTSENFNEIRFEDKKGLEQIFVNAERDLDINIENDSREHTHRNKNIVTCGEHSEFIKGQFSQKIANNKDVSIDGNYSINVGGKLSIKAPSIHLEADQGITLHVGGSTFSVWPKQIEVEGGPLVFINMGASQVGLTAAAPTPPQVADNGQFGGANPSSSCTPPKGDELDNADLDDTGETKTQKPTLKDIQADSNKQFPTQDAANPQNTKKLVNPTKTQAPQSKTSLGPTQSPQAVKEEINRIQKEIDQFGGMSSEKLKELTKGNLLDRLKLLNLDQVSNDKLRSLITEQEFLREVLNTLEQIDEQIPGP